MKSIDEPVKLVVENAGEEGAVVLDAIRKSTEKDFGFDADLLIYGNMFELGIIDPVKVTRSALENAASVAAMVLTTESMITDLPEKSAAMAPQMPHMDY